MELLTNIPEVIKRLEKLKASIGGTGGGGNPPAIDFSDAMFGAINAVRGKMLQRIFNDSLDAEGNALGKYTGPKTRLTKEKLSKTKYSIQGISVGIDEEGESERKKGKRNLNRFRKQNPDDTYSEYEKLRLAHGRFIDKKDLEFSGSLRFSIQTVKTDEGKVVVAIRNTDDAKKAKYQEQQIGNIRAGVNANTGNATPAKIFLFSQEEFDEIKHEGNKAIRQLIKDKFEQL